MSISFMTINAENNPYACCIEIHFSTSLSSISGFDKLIINRKVSGSTTWQKVYEKTVTTINDLDFTAVDMLTMSGSSYIYSIDLVSGTNPPSVNETLDPVECWYEGIFVGNSDKQFIATANYETSADLQTQVEYVNTLSGRTPYRVSNADTCYYTGSFSGLFLEVGLDMKTLLPDTYYKRAIAVTDFLSDGTDKLLKTDNGLMWYVSIDKTIQLPFNDRFTGMNTIRFDWTEIGDLPLAWVVEK